MTNSKPHRDLVIPAWLAEHPGSTAREIAGMLCGRRPTQSEHSGTSQTLRQLKARGLIEKVPGSWPGRWRLVGQAEPSADGTEDGPIYAGADDLLPVRRVDIEACSHLLRAYLRTGAVGDPTRLLICRLDAILAKHRREVEG